jgi:hypothetical protein
VRLSCGEDGVVEAERYVVWAASEFCANENCDWMFFETDKNFSRFRMSAFVGLWIDGAAGDANTDARAVGGLGFDRKVAPDEPEALLHAD